MTRQAISTTTVPWISCFWPGHSTFFSSAQDSPTKLRSACAAARRRARLPAALRRLAPGAAAGALRGARSTAARLSAWAARRARRSERVWRAT